MKLTVLTIAGIAVALALTAALVFSLRPHHLGAPQSAEYRQQLLSEDPATRLEAAGALLKDNAADEEAVLVKAAALVELDRFGEARKTLDGILHRKAAPPQRALLIVAESYLDEAANAVAAGSPSTVDLTYTQVRDLFAELDSTRQLLTPDQSAVLLIQARQADLSATLSRRAARPLAAELTQARESKSDSDVDPVVSDLVARRRQLESTVERFCRQALAKDPEAADAYLLLVQMWLRAGRYDKAREDADRLVHLAHVERVTAGRVAGELLNLEENYGERVLPGDVDLCVRLLYHPGLTGRHHASFLLAQADLALRQGRLDEADKLAARVLETAPNARASCQRAAVLLAQNKPEKAVDLLLSLAEQRRAPITWEALGMAYLASARARQAAGQKDLAEDQVRQGRTMLRQALDLAPDLLPARLAMAQSLAASGNLDQAQNDIAAAARINPLHPQLRSLQIQVLVQRTDLAALAAALVAAGDDDAARFQPGDVALVGLLALDDRAAVRRIVDPVLGQPVPPPLALIANAWLGAEPWKRRLVAAAVAQSLLERLDADPLQRPLPPDGADLSPPAPASDGGGSPAVDVGPLAAARLVSSPEEIAAELLNSALELWPDNPALLEQAGVFNLLLGRPGPAARFLGRLAPAARSPWQRALAAWAHSDAEAARRELAAGQEEPKPPVRLWLELALALQSGDRAGAKAQLTKALADHPCFEPALLLFLGDAVKRHEIDQARAVLQGLGEDSQAMALIGAGRLDLALGNPVEAFTHATAAEPLLPENLARRWYLADIRATANLALKRGQEAQDIFAGLVASWPQQRVNLHWRWVDLLCDWDQARRAADIVAGPLTDRALTARQVDLLLARCALLMSGEHLGAVVDDQLKFRKDQALLLLYRAKAYEKDGDAAAAESAIDRALRIDPQAPRSLMAKAHLARVQRRLPEALAIYEQLIRRGGRTALAATVESEQVRASQGAAETSIAPVAGGGR